MLLAIAKHGCFKCLCLNLLIITDLFCSDVRKNEVFLQICKSEEEEPTFNYLGYGSSLSLMQSMKIREMKAFLQPHLVSDQIAEFGEFCNSTVCIKKGSFGQLPISQNNTNKVFFKRQIASSSLLEVELSKNNDHCDNIILGSLFFVNGFDFYSSYKYSDVLITLRMVSQHRKLSNEQSVFCLKEIANGLNYLQQKGIIHCNLSQDSIFVQNNCLKIANFSFACLAHFSKEIFVRNRNFPQNGPDQIWQEVAINFSTDIWGLGIIFTELMSNKKNYPFPEMAPKCPPIEWQKNQFTSKYFLKLNFECPLAKEFALQCLNFSSQLRPNLKEIFKHNLFKITQQLF